MQQNRSVDSNQKQAAIVVSGIVTLCLIFFLFLGSAIFFGMIEQNTALPHYVRGTYTEGEVVFPGEWVDISLGEPTAGGVYYIRHKDFHIISDAAAHIAYQELEFQGQTDTGIARLDDIGNGFRILETQLTYRPGLKNEIARGKVRIPDDATLFGKKISIDFRLQIGCPMIFGPKNFEWQNKEIVGNLVFLITDQANYSYVRGLRTWTWVCPFILIVPTGLLVFRLFRLQ